MPQAVIRLEVVPRPPASPMSNRASRPWTGATRVFRCPVRASRRVGMCTSQPSAPGRSRPSVPCGKAIEPAFRGRLRNRNVGINVTQGRMDRPVASDHKGSSGESRGDGDARRSDRRVDGERLLRRLEAALNGLPARIVGAGATPGRRGRGCENTLASMPHQALGAGGRSRHGTRRRCATAHPAAVPQDVGSPPYKRERRCESSAGRSVNRPPSSFSHRGAACWGARGLLSKGIENVRI